MLQNLDFTLILLFFQIGKTSLSFARELQTSHMHEINPSSVNILILSWLLVWCFLGQSYLNISHSWHSFVSFGCNFLFFIFACMSCTGVSLVLGRLRIPRRLSSTSLMWLPLIRLRKIRLVFLNPALNFRHYLLYLKKTKGFIFYSSWSRHFFFKFHLICLFLLSDLLSYCCVKLLTHCPVKAGLFSVTRIQ